MTETIAARPIAPADEATAIALVGNPNVGKSVLFGALTGRYVTVSNYPGTTVELTSGTMLLGKDRVSILDTPGTCSLLPSSEDERVTRDVLLSGRARTRSPRATACSSTRGSTTARDSWASTWTGRTRS